ncbi:Gamma-D-glutamyl-L-lysine endopeptidase [Methyloligella halotolerans]|uniref:Gamma-D-glutamyl-L-lysine endopeptidase n=1 Tax=Methyloligella halotolerans TaxID=1177755 RepID=A0A1E2RWF6_9HYPH|nr:NlpC/P60 family protein [Methyloligella halotolerans]ODA66399.1 Gamma-D-glutamyl-L-lysine endopeptidase [Methyloligella halotolerans]
MTTDGPPDPRLHPYRDDLAAEYLRGRIEAPRYVEGTLYRIGVSHLPLRRRPDPGGPLETEGLFGERATVFDEKDGWGWAQLQDGYVGYLEMEGLRKDLVEPTHRLTVLRSYLYPEPDIKTPPLDLISINALLAVEGREGPFLKLATGEYAFGRHAKPVETAAEDYVALAETFLGTPYLWGGKTSLGLDCSGLVQLSLQAAGFDCPRDTDMQRDALGEPVEDLTDLRRGDLVFWRGHVGMMRSTITLLHANAHHMAVAAEPLEDARERIASEGAAEMEVRRMPGLTAGGSAV